jgi:hypothetical protein
MRRRFGNVQDFTLVNDLNQSRVLYVAEDRNQSAWMDFGRR